MKSFSLIAAVDSSFGLGKNGGIPWRLKSDMKFFRDVTLSEADGRQNAVIMGRATWESLPERFRPLPGRHNLVLSRSLRQLPGTAGVYSSLDDALEWCDVNAGRVFIIGGAEIYRLALSDPRAREIILTHVEGDFSCDVFLDKPGAFSEKEEIEEGEESGIRYRMIRYSKILPS